MIIYHNKYDYICGKQTMTTYWSLQFSRDISSSSLCPFLSDTPFFLFLFLSIRSREWLIDQDGREMMNHTQDLTQHLPVRCIMYNSIRLLTSIRPENRARSDSDADNGGCRLDNHDTSPWSVADGEHNINDEHDKNYSRSFITFIWCLLGCTLDRHLPPSKVMNVDFI